MDSPHPTEVTQLLNEWCAGDPHALEKLAPLVENDLRQLARTYLGRESSNHTLQPTALINEAYLRLIQWETVGWQNRAHFRAVAAKIMRRILVNQAVARKREKRSGSAIFVSINEADGAVQKTADIVALDDALNALAEFDERKSQIVELRFFAGLSAEEVAEALNISARTVHREWDLARAWLFRELKGQPAQPD